eukprot:TRINITY_DN22132_c0_g2_i1.p1 TRINITY_DN22132_c0_g2~~TRINITY_DN22132_c0_g2_i1.p1  ORF type:complete len:295 (-),score=56.90 TRINITY_DN22132_c0_g2_i1:75-896(-)
MSSSSAAAGAGSSAGGGSNGAGGSSGSMASLALGAAGAASTAGLVSAAISAHAAVGGAAAASAPAASASTVALAGAGAGVQASASSAQSSDSFAEWYTGCVRREIDAASVRAARKIQAEQLRTWLLVVRRKCGRTALIPHDVRTLVAAYLGEDQLPSPSAARVRAISDAAIALAKPAFDAAVKDVLNRIVMPQVVAAAENCKFAARVSVTFTDPAVRRMVDTARKLDRRPSLAMQQVAMQAGFRCLDAVGLDNYDEYVRQYGPNVSTFFTLQW